MSKPTPAHWKTVDIPAAWVERTYDEPRAGIGGRGWWIIVAAASVHLAPDEKPPAEGYVRVIVAPARVAP